MSDPSVSPADTGKPETPGNDARYEIDVLIGPCSQAECETLMEAILDLPETTAVGGVVACGPWTGEQTRRVLLAVGERDKAEVEAAESLAAAHQGRAESLAAEVERLTAERERDRRQIEQLTEALEAAASLAEFLTPKQRETYECGHGATVNDICPEDCEAHSQMVTAAAVLADKEDAP